MQIIYGKVTVLVHFFAKSNSFIHGYAHFLHFILFSLSKFVYYCVQKGKGIHVFRKTEIIQVGNIVSSLAQKRNPVETPETGFLCLLDEWIVYRSI